jgi:hypothetical protein
MRITLHYRHSSGADLTNAGFFLAGLVVIFRVFAIRLGDVWAAESNTMGKLEPRLPLRVLDAFGVDETHALVCLMEVFGALNKFDELIGQHVGSVVDTEYWDGAAVSSCGGECGGSGGQGRALAADQGAIMDILLDNSAHASFGHGFRSACVGSVQELRIENLEISVRIEIENVCVCYDRFTFLREILVFKGVFVVGDEIVLGQGSSTQMVLKGVSTDGSRW